MTTEEILEILISQGYPRDTAKQILNDYYIIVGITTGERRN